MVLNHFVSLFKEKSNDQVFSKLLCKMKVHFLLLCRFLSFPECPKLPCSISFAKVFYAMKQEHATNLCTDTYFAGHRGKHARGSHILVTYMKNILQGTELLAGEWV